MTIDNQNNLMNPIVGSHSDDTKKLIKWLSKLAYLGLYAEDYHRDLKGSPAGIFYPPFPGVIKEFGSTILQTEPEINKYFSEMVEKMTYELLKVFVLKTGYFYNDDSLIIRLKKTDNHYPTYFVQESIKLWKGCEEAEIVFMAKSEKRAKWVENWINKALNGKAFQEVIEETLRNHSSLYIEQLRNDSDLDLVLDIDCYAGDCPAGSSYYHAPEVKYSTGWFPQEKLIKVSGSYEDSSKKNEEPLFIIAEKDAETLRGIVATGGSCTSLGNQYAYDKKCGVLTITNQETGEVLRQFHIGDAFSFSMATG